MAEHDLRREFLGLGQRVGSTMVSGAPGSRSPVRSVSALLLAVVVLAAGVAGAAAPKTVNSPSGNSAKATDARDVLGLIVKFEADAGLALPAAALRETRLARISSLLAPIGVRVSYVRTLASGAELLRFDQLMGLGDAEAMAATVSRLEGVRYAAPNRTIRPQAVPTDPDFPSQWGFQYVPGSAEGANFVSAWDITRGAASQTIGVIDAGISGSNEEIVGQLRRDPLFPNGGYDFYSTPETPGDGDGRDDDPEQLPSTCGHGTHVAGTIGARTAFAGLGVGIAGGAPDSKLLIARALSYSGTDADAIDAMHWMAGDTVPGVEVNPNIPVAINMSFGASGGSCGPAYQEAVDALRAAAVVPVAAAGNTNQDVAIFAPANCRGVVAVAAADTLGAKASFSNYGAGVVITAPGVDILSTGGAGSTNVSCFKSGTSMASPHVTAAVGLMRTLMPSLNVNQVALALKSAARPFPVGSTCTTSICGAGLLDARRSLDALTGSVVRIGWNEPAVTLRENDGNLVVTVSRIGNPSQAVTVGVVADPGTALAGVDYGTPSSTTLTWAANDVSDRTVTVPIIARSGEQGTRAFALRLYTISGGTQIVAPASINVTINEVDCNSVTPILFGETKSGSLDVDHPENYCHGGVRGPAFNTVRYSFAGNAGDVVSIDMTSTTAAPNVLDTYVYLLGPDKRVLAENDDIVSTVNRNSRIVQHQLTQTGTHYIDATTYGSSADATGSFNLRLYHCGGYVAGSTCSVDIDGDGLVDSTDSLLAVRRLAGMTGSALVVGQSFRACASRTTASAVASFIDAQNTSSGPPLAFDLDGDGQVLASTDGLLLVRALLGLTGDAVITGALGPAATRNTWPLIRTYLNGQCGLALLP